jgi:hypothetical protein
MVTGTARGQCPPQADTRKLKGHCRDFFLAVTLSVSIDHSLMLVGWHFVRRLLLYLKGGPFFPNLRLRSDRCRQSESSFFAVDNHFRSAAGSRDCIGYLQ